MADESLLESAAGPRLHAASTRQFLACSFACFYPTTCVPLQPWHAPALLRHRQLASRTAKVPVRAISSAISCATGAVCCCLWVQSTGRVGLAWISLLMPQRTSSSMESRGRRCLRR